MDDEAQRAKSLRLWEMRQQLPSRGGYFIYFLGKTKYLFIYLFYFSLFRIYSNLLLDNIRIFSNIIFRIFSNIIYLFIRLKTNIYFYLFLYKAASKGYES